MKRISAFLISIIFMVALIVTGCNDSQGQSNDGKINLQLSSHNHVVAVSDVQWEPLNPARGDKSPKAGTLWGDRNDTIPTGFLAKFANGFSSPPHIHNVTYRAVVISGTIHNDDPDADNMWMPAGSFWTQPAGQLHITTAKGENNLALVEIDHGPYLVRPPEDSFDNGERPINIDESNLVWVSPTNQSSLPEGIKTAYLWGQLENNEWNGTFLKLPAGFSGRILNEGKNFQAVVIKGKITYGQEKPKELRPGSYFGADDRSEHVINSDASEDSILYVRTNGDYSLKA